VSQRLRWRFEPQSAIQRLRTVSDELDAAIAAKGATERTRFAARLVVEEIVLNAFEHGGARDVTLEANPDDDPLQLVLDDDGAEFDPAAGHDGLEFHAPSGASPRGRGLILVHKFAQRLEHVAIDGRNRLIVTLVA
jgi:anti-sigma regulatory factor (Ser/Thr protein kinase)